MRKTNKRTPPVRIHQRLVPHLRRWQRLDAARGITHIIHCFGKPVKTSTKTSWNKVREDAGLDQHVVLHTFRHTATTWFLQAGVSAWEVSGYVGMSVKMIEEHYGHHHPDYQSAAAKAVAPKAKRHEEQNLNWRMIANETRKNTRTKHD